MITWTMEERRALHALWGEEPWPVGWRAWRERLAYVLGEDRAWTSSDTLWLGGDAVLAVLALRAAVRARPSGVHLWCPPLGWEEAPAVWAALPDSAERLAALLGQRGGRPMAEVLGTVLGDTKALSDVHGGRVARVEGEVSCAPHPTGKGILWVARPSRTHARPAKGEAEAALRALHNRVLRHLDVWPGKTVAFIGGRSAQTHRIVAEIWLKKGEKGSIIHEEALSFSYPRSISEAMTLWWEAVESLTCHVPTENPDRCA